MAWWSKLLSRAPAQRPPPSWSAITDGAAFDRFTALVVEKLAAEGLEPDQVAVRSGSIVIGEGRERKEWFLHALAERCAAGDEATWPALTHTSFASIGRVDAPEPKARRARKKAERDNAPASRALKPLPDVRVQVFAESYLQSMPLPEIVGQPLGNGLRMVVVRDIGGLMEHMFTSREVRNWPRSEHDLLALGCENALRAELAGTAITRLETNAGDFELLVSNGFYLCASVLATLEKAGFPDGALVSFISWHHVLVHQVTSATTRETVHEMRRVATGVAENIAVVAMEALGGAIFWAHGAPPFEELEVEDGAVKLPAQLAAIIDR